MEQEYGWQQSFSAIKHEGIHLLSHQTFISHLLGA